MNFFTVDILQLSSLTGVTQSVYEAYGIPTSLLNNNTPMSNQFTIDLICPQLIDPKYIEEMQTEAGAIITIDTTIIEQLFLISLESEESPRDAAVGANGLTNTSRHLQSIDIPDLDEAAIPQVAIVGSI